jgi:hypothetical protein
VSQDITDAYQVDKLRESASTDEVTHRQSRRAEPVHARSGVAGGAEWRCAVLVLIDLTTSSPSTTFGHLARDDVASDRAGCARPI